MLKFLLFSILVLVPSGVNGSTAQWTWIYGQLTPEDNQEKYLQFVHQVHTYFEERNLMPGPLIQEKNLEAWPANHYIVIGPIQAFDEPSKFGLPLQYNDDGTVTIGEQKLKQGRTGIYLADGEGTRIVYTGLSYDGFHDIFTVPTGNTACTITKGRGQVLKEGKYQGKELVFESPEFLRPYPKPEDLKGLVLPAGAIKLDPVLAEPDQLTLDPDFAKWLDDFTQDQRVLFFGEGHWHQGVNHLFGQVTEHLLASQKLGAIFFEVNYSFTGFYNYYISEPDEKRAAEFLEKRLHPLVSSTSMFDLLQTLRQWNLNHPQTPVQIGCLDMEWGSANVIENIIQPYFRRLQSDFTLQAREQNPQALLQGLLDEAKEKGLMGEYPFLTPDYMEKVIQNLQTTRDIEDFQVDRQRGIIRNMTEFNGQLLEEEFILFKGGGWHALKNSKADENFYRDAAYLNEVHPTTKDKVVTLYAKGLGYNFSETAELDLDQQMSSAKNYNDFLRHFQEALADGRAQKEDFYLLDRLSIVDQLVIKMGYTAPSYYLRLGEVDWEKLEEVHGTAVRESQAFDYDAMIYILKSGIEVMRPREF